MELEFQIDHIFENVSRHGPHLLARKLSKDGDFKLTENLSLGGYGIKRFGMPRALDFDGNPQFDIYSFDLKNKSELSNFKIGQIVKLTE